MSNYELKDNYGDYFKKILEEYMNSGEWEYTDSGAKQDDVKESESEKNEEKLIEAIKKYAKDENVSNEAFREFIINAMNCGIVKE